MNRTNVMKTSKIAALSVIASSTVFGESVSASLKTQQPNILMIMADDVGFEHLGCYGTGENQTPEGLATQERLKHVFEEMNSEEVTKDRIKIKNKQKKKD